ncbi:MAG: hypothetical protein KG029_02340 [Bacteroidetes bacterium]|nr:hypothetical protein [Bacteroidota bacterium]
MNKLLIIGNGFDLAHGLETRYADFMLWYMNKAFLAHMDSIRENKFEDELISIVGVFKIREKFKSFAELNEFLSGYSAPHLNFKHEFIEKLFSNYLESRWVDIERAYFEQLIEYYQYCIKDNYSNKSYGIHLVREFHKVFEALKTKLSEYLATNDIGLADFQPSIESVFKRIINEKSERLKTQDLHEHYLILNFNYTQTVNLYESVFPVNVSIINIHGTISKDPEAIIFGYGDKLDNLYQQIENLNENAFLDHLKYFWYLKNENYRRMISFCDTDKYKIYILGHSCGLSDRVLLNLLFGHPNCSEIEIFYHDRKNSTNDFDEKIREISRHFSPENKDAMMRKIVSFEISKPLS